MSTDAEYCTRCHRKRPDYIADPSRRDSGYCTWEKVKFMPTYEGHYPGCTSHPDHEGDCTVARSLPTHAEQLESVGKIRLEALGLLDRTTDALERARTSIEGLHTCEMTMHEVARSLAEIAAECNTRAERFLSGDPLPEPFCSVSDRLHALAVKLLAKP